MGQLYRFRCACGYEAEVSGGTDCGMIAETATVVCADCRALFDVEVAEFNPGRRMPVPAIPCPRCHRLGLKRWRHRGLCPRCGARELAKGERTVLWD